MAISRKPVPVQPQPSPEMEKALSKLTDTALRLAANEEEKSIRFRSLSFVPMTSMIAGAIDVVMPLDRAKEIHAYLGKLIQILEKGK